MAVGPGEPGHDRALDVILVTNYDPGDCERTFNYRKCYGPAKFCVEVTCRFCGSVPFRLCEPCAEHVQQLNPAVQGGLAGLYTLYLLARLECAIYCTVRRQEHQIIKVGSLMPFGDHRRTSG